MGGPGPDQRAAGLVDRNPLPPDFLEVAHDFPVELSIAERVLTLQRQPLGISETLPASLYYPHQKRDAGPHTPTQSLFSGRQQFFGNEDASLVELEAAFRVAIKGGRGVRLLSDLGILELGRLWKNWGSFISMCATILTEQRCSQRGGNGAKECHARGQGLERVIQIVSGWADTIYQGAGFCKAFEYYSVRKALLEFGPWRTFSSIVKKKEYREYNQSKLKLQKYAPALENSIGTIYYKLWERVCLGSLGIGQHLIWRWKALFRSQLLNGCSVAYRSFLHCQPPADETSYWLESLFQHETLTLKSVK